VPKTSSGKIRRVAAREYYERGPRAVKPQAVWLQFVRLVLAGVGPQLRRGWRTARGLLFAARAWAVIGLLFPLVFLSCWIVPGAPAWRVTGKCARLFFRLARIPFVARGLENLPASPCVLAVNHTSYLDGVALLAALAERPFAFVAKRELKGNLVTRVIVAGLGSEFIERFDVQKSVEHADELAAAVKRGVSLLVFPEGTFQRQAGLMPFRAGGFQAAAQAGAPLVPAAIRGARSVLREGTWFLRRSPVTVNIAAPVQPAGSDWNAVVRLRDEARAEILKRSGEPDLAQ
jgi:1-acyl-sn-glycerol-3-phosphate acyltransferase